MRLRRLWLTDFRSYPDVELSFGDGLTALVGANGQGKSNLLEAVAWLATLSSFRDAPTEALVRTGAERAVVRAEVERDGRTVLIEAELPRTGRARVQVNRQRLARSRDLLGALRVTVFAPDDLRLVKGGPGERRRWLDEVMVAEHPSTDALRGDLERILRQRNALLRQSGGRATPDVVTTLDVWDDRLVETATALGWQRADLVGRLEPLVGRFYALVADGERGAGVVDPSGDVAVGLTYEAPWRAEGLAAALAEVRRDELRRGVTLVGPHRDDLIVTLDGMPARSHASQGEQRSLALALRLAQHALVTEAAGSPPVLLLDDVFSELDDRRSAALVAHLPAGQTLLTTATGLPDAVEAERVWHLVDGSVQAGD